MEQVDVDALLVGGHHDRFSFASECDDNSILLKKTSEQEAIAYRKIFQDNPNDDRHEANLIFRKFLPKFYGVVHQERANEHFIKVENLLKSREKASILDIKMGTCSITVNTKPER